MKVLFIVPHVGKKDLAHPKRYVKTWQMEPTNVATLKALTPSWVDVLFIDERLGEPIVLGNDIDLVAITAETYTAKRAYEICALCRDEGIPVVVGGWQAMLIPEEVLEYADAVVTGYAENVWPQVIEDAAKGALKQRYDSRIVPRSIIAKPDRSVYADRSYFAVTCVETGRGCPLVCNFCSIAQATGSKYSGRLIEGVVDDVKSVGNDRLIFLVEDNFFGNPKHTKEVLRAMIPLKIRWVGQGTLILARDEEMLELLRESGCVGLLIGFESFKAETLEAMNKKFNTSMLKYGSYKELIARIHKYGLAIYGTFIFGYDTDTVTDFRQTTEQAIDYGIAIAAFNHLLPFPNTPLYHDLKRQGRLINDPWWLQADYYFGEIPFIPKHMSPERLHEECIRARERFYSVSSIFRRMFVENFRGTFATWRQPYMVGLLNYLLRREIREKDGLPLGNDRQLPRKKNEQQARARIAST